MRQGGWFGLEAESQVPGGGWGAAARRSWRLGRAQGAWLLRISVSGWYLRVLHGRGGGATSDEKGPGEFPFLLHI